jgi:hypothetical protein
VRAALIESQKYEEATGLRRKCRNMVRHIVEQTQSFPQPHRNFDYWHLHLPVAQGFIGSASTRLSVQRLCVQTLISRRTISHPSRQLLMFPHELSCNLVTRPLGITIIVFFGTKYFDTFFNRSSDTQRWSQLPVNRSLIRERNLSTPKGSSERGYLEEISEPDYNHKGELWFIGQLTAG